MTLPRAALEEKVIDEGHIYDNDAGFRRTDALARIGNQVFAADMRNAANYVVANAPVRYPQIWDASWFNWVQYNSSIADPLARNIGEALGVRAVVKLHGTDAASFENSVNIRGLRALENLLAGPGPLKGLASPKWPSVFPPLDQGKVARGAALYQQHCQGCHLPPLPELMAELDAAYRRSSAEALVEECAAATGSSRSPTSRSRRSAPILTRRPTSTNARPIQAISRKGVVSAARASTW